MTGTVRFRSHAPYFSPVRDFEDTACVASPGAAGTTSLNIPAAFRVLARPLLALFIGAVTFFTMLAVRFTLIGTIPGVDVLAVLFAGVPICVAGSVLHERLVGDGTHGVDRNRALLQVLAVVGGWLVLSWFVVYVLL